MARYCEKVAQSWLGDKFVIRRDFCSLKANLTRFLRAESVENVYETRRRTFRREIKYDDRVLQIAGTEKRRGQESYKAAYAYYHFPSWESLTIDIREIDRAIQRFQARGGQVVFLRAPSSGERLQYEERFHAKRTNWDRFAACTVAPCIHFNDVPTMRDLACPDESHLDFRDSPNFSRALIRELTRRGVFLDSDVAAGSERPLP